MREQEPVVDFFSQSAALIENVCELQRNFADEFFDRLRHADKKNTAVDTATECCRNLFSGIANNPSKIAERQIEHWQQQLQLCSNLLLKLIGETVEPVARPRSNDRRFDDVEWESNALFDFIKQSYLLTAEHALQSVNELEGVSARDRERLNYFMRQLINALAPTNFAFTNPDVLRKTFATQGKNLIEGLQLMVEDKKRSADILNVCTSKPNAFKVGHNIAHTPGAVVAENELMQLIQYAPTTPRVQATPILIVPSWVNKYYILDLTEKNSFIRWLVEQGNTVFAISWVNPDESFRDVQFFDYMAKGPLFAADEIARITGSPQVSAIGYCLGGILLACALAYTDRLRHFHSEPSHSEPSRFASATYLGASFDFSDPGDIGIFVEEGMIDSVEQQMQRQGYLDGRLLAAGFSLLKENDLYWNYYVINYLKGERPIALDLLHWNSDNTNVPAATHRFVMRELHLKNGLINRGTIVIDDWTIDLRETVTPTYVLGTDKDHIARWRSCYAVTQLQSGAMRFVLAGSGHIAGVINPPCANKYYHYINADIPPTADAWLQHAQRVEGSWWPDWLRWQREFGGPLIAARQIDGNRVIEPAPGRYVRQRLDYASHKRDAA